MPEDRGRRDRMRSASHPGLHVTARSLVSSRSAHVSLVLSSLRARSPLSLTAAAGAGYHLAHLSLEVLLKKVIARLLLDRKVLFRCVYFFLRESRHFMMNLFHFIERCFDLFLIMPACFKIEPELPLCLHVFSQKLMAPLGQ